MLPQLDDCNSFCNKNITDNYVFMKNYGRYKNSKFIL